MSGCEDIRELLSGSLDGELTEAEARRLEAHLASCEACRHDLAELERVWEGLGVLGEAELPEDLAGRVYARVAGSRERAGRPRRGGRWAYSLATAAALIAAFVVGHVLSRNGQLDPETKQIVRDIDLLDNLEVLENLDVLEMLGDGVLVVPSEDTTNSSDGGES